MQIVPLRDNLHEISKPAFFENKINVLKRRLLIFLLRMLSINEAPIPFI